MDSESANASVTVGLQLTFPRETHYVSPVTAFHVFPKRSSCYALLAQGLLVVYKPVKMQNATAHKVNGY